MPQHKRGPWSSQEDQLLLTLVNVHGAHNWVRISSTIGTRSPKQCRERFHQNLKPNLNHDPISPEEGLLIEQMVSEMGKRWAEIARRLRGRSDNAVKNWWNGSMNRRRRNQDHRRQELGVRQSIVQQPLPAYHQHAQMSMSQELHPQYYASYHQQRSQFRQSFLPSNAPPLQNRSAFVDSSLPSPSTFSALSAEGAPSLMSDSSSSSARSPNNGSPIELPPLSGTREERRNSSVTMLQLGAPSTFATEEYMMEKHPSMMHDSYGRSMAPAYQRVTSYPNLRQHPLMPNYSHHYLNATSLPPPPPAQVLKSQAITPVPTASVQLPSISDLASPQQTEVKSQGLLFDAGTPPHGTPLLTASPVDGSPKDKMSLSNITS